jgi:hypothetical protein
MLVVILLSIACQQTTSTTTSTTTSARYLAQDLARLLQRYTERIDALTFGSFNEQSQDDYMGKTFLRDDLIEFDVALDLYFLNVTAKHLLAVLAMLHDCPNVDQTDVCISTKDTIRHEAKWRNIGGYLRIDSFLSDTSDPSSQLFMPPTYHAVLLRESDGAIALSHRIVTAARTVNGVILTHESESFHSYQEDGDWERVDISNSNLVHARFDHSSGIMMQADLYVGNVISVTKSDQTLNQRHVASFNSESVIDYHEVWFGLGMYDLRAIRNPAWLGQVQLAWNAFSVGGWDRVSFEQGAPSRLRQGETLLGIGLNVYGEVQQNAAFLSLYASIPLADLTASKLSLSEWGLAFDAVSLETFQTALTLAPSEGKSWIDSMGFTFDRAATKALILKRITLPIDEGFK